MQSLRFQSVFDIIGPVMIGPSSSHTAGAVRIGKIVSSIFDDTPTEVEFQLFNSFAKTYRGHGTDLALVAGILGMDTDDPEIPNSLEIAHKRGIKIVWTIQKDSNAPHPNTTKITVKNERKTISVTGISIGGGNIFRGVSGMQEGFDRVTGDTMGMLATIMNGLALQDAIERLDIPTRVLTAIQMPQVAEPFIRRRAIRHLEKKRVVIFAGGTGNPYFTTDSCGALRAVEIHADVLAKGTKVDGIYDKDPMKFDDAVRYDTVTFDEAINKNLGVMDTTALSLCRENDMPIIVFNALEEGNILKMVQGENIGTVVVKK